MTHLLDTSHLAQGLDEGDAVLVLKKAGGFQIFNTHTQIDPNNLTARQLEQGRMLAAFAAALQVPAVMQILYDLSESANVFTSEPVNYGVKN